MNAKAFRRPGNSLLLRLQLRGELRRSGHSWSDANQVLSGFTPELVDHGFEVLKAEAQTYGVTAAQVDSAVRKLGDGSIWQAIMDFFKSPMGQALIQILLKLLLGGIGLGVAGTTTSERPEGVQTMTSSDEGEEQPLPDGATMRVTFDATKYDMDTVRKGWARVKPFVAMAVQLTENKYDDTVYQFIDEMLSLR